LAETGIQRPEAPVSVEQLRQEPKQYLGRLLVVEGVLAALGKGFQPRFLLRSEGGAEVEV